MQLRILFVVLFTSAALFAQAPVADHHQHLFSPPMSEFQKLPAAITASDVIKILDEAGIKRGVLLSTAYSYGRPGREPQNEYEKVKEENDWVGAQAALYPKRLIAFCGVNPLKDYALEEIARCAKNPNTRRGIKLHFGNSDVQLENPQHVEKLKAVFRAANANRMAIVVHMRASFSLNRPYGAEQARAFIEQLLPAAPDVTVQVAHLASSGPGYNDPKADAVMDVFVDAIAKRDRRVRNVWFDLTTNIHPSNSPERAAIALKRIRQIGVKRILYGSDAALGGNQPPREAWAEISKLGLTPSELKIIANNRAPYLR
jgi:predicted TIM-barrel fold metal-dependent hydrolase